MTEQKIACINPAHLEDADPDTRAAFERLNEQFGRVMADLGDGTTVFDLARHYARHCEELSPEELVMFILLFWQVLAHKQGTSIDKPESLVPLSDILISVVCGVRAGSIVATIAKIGDYCGEARISPKIRALFQDCADKMDLKVKAERLQRAKEEAEKEEAKGS